MPGSDTVLQMFCGECFVHMYCCVCVPTSISSLWSTVYLLYLMLRSPIQACALWTETNVPFSPSSSSPKSVSQEQHLQRPLKGLDHCRGTPAEPVIRPYGHKVNFPLINIQSATQHLQHTIWKLQYQLYEKQPATFNTF